MGYSNIIDDSLVDNRSDINEGGLLMDNKILLRKIEKQLHFFEEAFLLGCVSNNLFFIDWLINNRRMYSGYFGLRLRISDTMYKWVEEGNSLYYCIDLNALLSYNNIKYFILGGNLEICSIHGNSKKECVVYHTISDVVNKGYTSNSGSDLVLSILSKDRFRINLSDDKKSWVETRYPR